MFKGVIVDKKNIRNVRIKVVDIKGNIATFSPSDIPQLIEDLKESIDFKKDVIKRYNDGFSLWRKWCRFLDHS